MDFIKNFLDLSPQAQTGLTIVFSILAALAVAFVKSNFFQEMLTGIFDWKSKNKKSSVISITESNITNHDIFNYIDFWLYNQIASMQLRTQYRTAVFRKYLHIYFKTHKEVIANFVREENYKTMDHSKLRNSLLQMITQITIQQEHEMRSSGIPEVVILKMKNVLNDRFNLTIDLINSICDSSFMSNDQNYLQLYTFLNLMHTILDNTLGSVEPVCNKLNGELKGLSIDGFTEP